MSRWISDAYIRGLMKSRMFQGDCEATLWEQEVDRVVDKLPSIELKQGDDLISRADAIEAIARLHALNNEEEIRRAYRSNPHSTMTDFEDTLVSAFDAIYDIPSAEPKRGEWIVKQSGFAECSVCEQHYFSDYNFCPNCGARMTERSE